MKPTIAQGCLSFGRQLMFGNQMATNITTLIAVAMTVSGNST